MLKTWHRTTGLAAALFLVFLTVTGLLLMQTDVLDLDSRYVGNDRLLDWYGIRPAPPPMSFTAAGAWITQLGERLYFNGDFLVNDDARLVGAIALDNEILVATEQTLLLLTPTGEIAEKLGAPDGVPAGLTHIGTTSEGTIVLQAASRFVFDPTHARLRPDSTDAPVRWRTSTPAPESMRRTIARTYRGSGLSLERIVLDLHTGRLFGALGVAIINLASVLLLLLVVSGVLLWWRRARRER